MELITSLLQNRNQFIKEIQESVQLKRKIIALLITSLICFGLYGLIIGLSHSVWQGISSTLKLPVLYILTLSICIPAFFIFSSLFGSRKNMWQGFALAMTATTVMSILLVGLAPVTLFFLITTDNYQFFKLLNVAFFAISGIIGAKLFYQSIKVTSEGEEQKIISRVWFLRLWIVLYAFVGSQLGWTLRPFFRESDMDFIAFQEVRGSFYSNVFKSLGHVLGADENDEKEKEAQKKEERKNTGSRGENSQGKNVRNYD